MDEELRILRKEIDALDKGILALVEKRVETAQKIGAIKAEKGLQISDPNREKEVLDNVTKTTKLEKPFVKDLFLSIIEYCKHAEQK
jgi:chorismate mutase